MRLLLLLLFFCHGAASETSLFRNCDEKTTLCYVLSSCKGESGDGLVRVSQLDSNSLTCRMGFELDFSADKSWSVTMKYDKGDQSPINNIELIVKNEANTPPMADCSRDINEKLYKSIKQDGDTSGCTVKIESDSPDRIYEPIADVFHLSYGQSELCMEVEVADGKKSSHCTEPIKFDVFNADCQTNNFIGTECHPDHKICEPALEKDNVFTCPDKEKNTIFLDNIFVSDSKVVRCTKDGWRSDDVSQKSTGSFIKKGKFSPQCVSLCENHFIRSTNAANSDSQPTITDGVMTCMHKTQAPIIDSKFHSGKLTCAESKWITDDQKMIEAKDGILWIKCASLIEQFMANECSVGLKTGKDSCGTFDNEDDRGMLKCAAERDAVVIYKGHGYASLFPNMETLEWWEPPFKVIGSIEEKEQPYCVFACSDVFINLQCDGRPSCSPAQFSGEQYDDTYDELRLYKSTLQCTDPNSIIIIDSNAQTVSKIECGRGMWKSGSEKIFNVIKYAKGSDKPFSVYCHNSCHESLLLNDCNGEVGCRSAIMNADQTVTCEDDTYFIEASADAWKTRTTTIEKIIDKKEFKTLKCSKEGWIGDGTTVIDFKNYPQNDINVNCRSRCSEKFIKCDKLPCPVIALPKITCPNDDNIWINDKPTMFDMLCDPKEGWHERDSNTIIVDFNVEPVYVNVKCINSCTEDLIDDDCAGHEECKPKLVGKKLSCEGAGRVMRVNTHLEFGYLTCTRNEWTMNRPHSHEAIISRKTHDEKIKVACLSKCHDSFINHSPCVKDKSCDASLLNGPDLTHLTCALPTNYIVVNSIISATPFVCDPEGGWTNGAGQMAREFNLREVHVDAHCLRNCDVSRIQDDCKGAKGCQTFTYANDVLSCPDGFVLNVNNNDVFEDVRCEAGGFRMSSNGSFLLAFDVTNTKEGIRAKCVSKCDDNYVNRACDGEHCVQPTLSDGTLKCEDKQDLLVLGTTPVYSSILHCDPKVGWKEGDTVVHDFKGPNVHVDAICRQPCNSELVRDTSSKDHGIERYIKGDSLNCKEPKKYRLFLNDTEAGEVTCDSRGWKDEAGKYAVHFTAETAGHEVVAECRHKCDPRFVTQICDSNATSTCSNAIYEINEKNRLSCAHPSELLVINDKESPDDRFLFCSDDGWKNGLGPDAKTIIDTTTTVLYTMRVQCVQLCHPDFITQKPETVPFIYSLDGKLTCENDVQMLVAQNTNVYSDLTCDKDGWRDEKKSLLFPFHQASNHVRKIEAGCEENDCLSRGFAPPCNRTEPSNECKAPVRTAYTLTCQDPFKLVANIETFIHYPSANCKDGKWTDPSGNHIREGDETPMRFQCFAAGCTNCTDSLARHCDNNLDFNCDKRKFSQGSKTYCSRYECDSTWWKITTGESTVYRSGTVTCGENGVEYNYRDETESYTLTGSLDCVKHVSCSQVSPLNTKCDGLSEAAGCLDNFLNAHEKSPERLVVCPSETQLYHSTGDNSWETGTGLQCERDGRWMMEVEGGERRSIEKGERVICASGDPVIPTTTAPPTTPNPGKPCIGCRAVLNLITCDGCSTLEEGMLSFSHEGSTCVAKSSSNVFEVDGDFVYNQALHCKFENDRYVWRTDEDKEVAAFAAHKSKPPMFAGASKIGAVIGIVVLILAGIGGAVLFYFWWKIREEQKRVALTTKGLEQKNDSIIDSIQYDEPKTIQI